LCRLSTSFRAAKEDVDARAKPGHDDFELNCFYHRADASQQQKNLFRKFTQPSTFTMTRYIAREALEVFLRPRADKPTKGRTTTVRIPAEIDFRALRKRLGMNSAGDTPSPWKPAQVGAEDPQTRPGESRLPDDDLARSQRHRATAQDRVSAVRGFAVDWRPLSGGLAGHDIR